MTYKYSNEKGFLIVAGKASDFLAIGCGFGGGIEETVMTAGDFEGFKQITVKGGKKLCCDGCMHLFKPDDEVFFVAVLNRILCKGCFDDFYEFAVWHNSDKRIEERNYKNIISSLKDKNLFNQ